MRTYLKRALWGTLIAGGITLLGATAANAAETSGDDGLLSGTQVEAPISAPISVLGNAVSVLDDAVSSAPAPAPAPASGHPGTPRHPPRRPAARRERHPALRRSSP
nr:chaplin family protein [Microbacterium barkeri]